MSSSENEFDSENDFEQEISLYTQLYYGDAIEVNENLHSNNKESINYDPNDRFQISSLGSEVITQINKLYKSPSNIIHEKVDPCNDKVNENFQKLPENNALEKDIPCKDISLKLPNIISVKNIKTNNVKKIKKIKRKRNPSICSIDSISGREPLDNLYCHIEDDLLDPIEEDSSDELQRDERLSSKKFITNISSKDEGESILNEIFNKPHSKPKLQNKVDIESSDDEDLPLNKSETNLTSTIEVSSSSSDESIEFIKSVNLKKAKKKKEAKKIKKEAKRIKKESKKIKDLSFKQDDNNNPSTPVFFKFGSKILSSEKKKISTSKISKSCVIYTKNRPLTKRTPSCPTWTQEMANFYDSDCSGEFSVEDVHSSQNKNPKLWKICAQDYQCNAQKRSRYFEQCSRCKEYGHRENKCPKPRPCLICGSKDHEKSSCPQICCLNCGKQPPHKYCALTFKSKICTECKQSGHSASICPDLWRRFHATTSGSVPVIPNNKNPSSVRKKNSIYCYNCAKKGHFGHECKALRPSGYQNGYRILCSLVSTKIFSYSSEFPFSKKIVNLVSIDDDNDDDDVQVVNPPEKLVTSSSQKNKQNNNEKEITTTICSVTLAEANRFITRQARIKTDIGKMVNSRIQRITLNAERNKILIIGPRISGKLAERVIFYVIHSLPYDAYSSLIESFNNEQMNSPTKKRKKKKTDSESPSVFLISDQSPNKPVKIVIETTGIAKINSYEKQSPVQNINLKWSQIKDLFKKFKNTENLFLPVPLPRKKEDIIKAVDKALMLCSTRSMRTQMVNQILKYFENGDLQSVWEEPEFLSNFQKLSCLSNLQLQKEKESCVTYMFCKFKRKLQTLSNNDTPSKLLYKKYSNIYLRLASPNIGYFNKYLEVVKRWQTLERPESEKEEEILQIMKNRRKLKKKNNTERNRRHKQRKAAKKRSLQIL